jgi:hypothetical protein
VSGMERREVGVPAPVRSDYPPDALAARAALDSGALALALERSASALSRRDASGGVGEDEAEIFLARVDALRAAGAREQAEAVRARGAARVLAVAGGISDPEWRPRFLERVEAHRRLVAGD